MPSGVYERQPGKRSKAQKAGNLPPRKFSKSNTGGKFSFNNGGKEQRATNSSMGASYQRGSSWLKQLLDLGYGIMGTAPNQAVQSILCMIPNNEIHMAMVEKFKASPQGSFSPVCHLGFSSWVEIFLKLDECKMVTQECLVIIEQIFHNTWEMLADRTDLEDILALEFKLGVSYLEKIHKVNDPSFEDNNIMGTQQSSIIPEVNQSGSFGNYIPREDIDLMKKEMDANVKEINKAELVRLTLHNCMRFPIISEMSVEWLGEEFDHGLWRSLNFSILAPISAKTWKLMANLNDGDMEEINMSAENMIKIVDSMDIYFPFGSDLFDKKCLGNSGVTLSVKAHMAFPGLERKYSYLHRIWRSFSPYFKCKCNGPCNDSITWFDQAIWYAFNHLDRVYPKFTQAGRMGSFLCFIQQNLKKPIMAQLAYMQVRDMMIKMTNKLAIDPDSDLQKTFGHTKLVEVCELMIKDKKFMADKFNLKEKEISTSVALSTPSQSDSISFFPPRVSRNNGDSSGKSADSIIDLSDSLVMETPGETSVSKGTKPGSYTNTIDGMLARKLYG